MEAHIDRNYVPDEAPESEIPCCMGSAALGPGRCTCWEPVYDVEQQPLRLEMVAKVGVPTRSECCEDCAYRQDSPERERGESDWLEGCADDLRSEFWCHQGARRIVAYRHPDGRVVQAEPGDYDPKITYDPRPYVWKADGTPQERCAGWAARREAVLRKRD